jgi:hypothetical protein
LSGNRFVKNFNLLNILLAAVILLMINYALLPYTGAVSEYALPSPKKTVVEKAAPSEGLNFPASSSFNIISDDNLFHPERKIPVEQKKAAEQQPLPTPDFVLYGTLITDNLRVAYLEDLKAPRNSPGRGKRQIVMKTGDMLNGFTLKEINPDKVVMARGEDKITVSVHDRQRLKTRETATAKPQAAAGQPPAPVQPPRPSSQAAPSSRVQRPPSVQDLVKPPAAPKTRAPNITGPEEKALDFFRRESP